VLDHTCEPRIGAHTLGCATSNWADDSSEPKKPAQKPSWSSFQIYRKTSLVSILTAAKIEWRPKKSPDAPYDIAVPGNVYDVDFMVKDGKRFTDSGGWGYAVFKHDAASDTFTPATLTHKPPQGNDAKCGFGCHTIVKGKDYIFTELGKR